MTTQSSREQRERIALTNAAGTRIMRVGKTLTTGGSNTITQLVGAHGGIERNYYGPDGKKTKQISNNNHGKPKTHPYGAHGEHAHEYTWGEKERRIDRTTRELTDDERKENSDIL